MLRVLAWLVASIVFLVAAGAAWLTFGPFPGIAGLIGSAIIRLLWTSGGVRVALASPWLFVLGALIALMTSGPVPD